jgi:hypothetical protein
MKKDKEIMYAFISPVTLHQKTSYSVVPTSDGNYCIQARIGNMLYYVGARYDYLPSTILGDKQMIEDICSSLEKKSLLPEGFCLKAASEQSRENFKKNLYTIMFPLQLRPN